MLARVVLPSPGGPYSSTMVERFTALLRCLNADGEQVLD